MAVQTAEEKSRPNHLAPRTVPPIKISYLQGNQNFPSLPTEGNQNFPSQHNEGNPKLPFQTKAFSTPRSQNRKNKKYSKTTNWRVKRELKQVPTHIKNVFSAFHFSPFYWEGSSEGFVVVCALTCESVFSYSPPRGYRETVEMFFLIRPPRGYRENRPWPENVFF